MGIDIFDRLRNLSNDSKEVTKVLEWTKKSLSILEKETWINFFKKAWDWLKKFFWFKSNESPDLTWNSTSSSKGTHWSDNLPHTTETIDTTQTFGIAEDGWDYTPNNSYTNSKSGIKYKLYDQTRWPWAWYRYDNTRTVSNNWCMLTSAAVVASSLWNFNVTPWDLFKSHKHTLVRDSVPAESNKKLKSNLIWFNKGWTQDANNETLSQIKENLQKWNPAIIMVKGRAKWWKSKFTSSQHYMALLDISDDGSKIFVGNSCTRLWWDRSSNGWYPTTDVLTSVREATLFTPIQT